MGSPRGRLGRSVQTASASSYARQLVPLGKRESALMQVTPIVQRAASRTSRRTNRPAPRRGPSVIPVRIPNKRDHDIVVGRDILTELPKQIKALGLSEAALI